jgi:hypothetical protein
MAKKKKTKKTGAKRSGKRVRGASATDALLMVVGGLIGGIGTTWANQKVTFLQGKIMGLVETAVGSILVWKVAHPFVKGLGVGVAISGGTNAAKGFGLLAGVGMNRNFRQVQPVNGFRQVPKIGNPNIPGRKFPQPNVVGRPVSARTYAGVYGN